MDSEKYTNKAIVQLLRNISAALQLQGANRFRIIAYDKAADAVEYLSRELKDLWQEGKLYKVKGIGPGIGSGLEEYFEKGESKHFNELLEGIPETVFILMNVPGIGPKRAFRLVQEFKLVDNKTVVEDLKKIAGQGRIAELEGFGEKSEQDILASLEIYQRQDRREDRMPLPYAGELAEEVMQYLKELPEVKRTDALGSLRRRVSTIGDIDIAVMADEKDSQKIIDHFLKYQGKLSNEGSGEKKASILAAGNIRIDLRVQDEQTYGSMLQYFTGSKAHNIQLREYALTKGYSLSEYGIKELGNKKEEILHTFPTEEGFYQFLGMQWIPSELREANDEIHRALKKDLPDLIQTEDIKGDFHIHSSYDLKPSHDLGKNTYEELVQKAKELGYKYVGFADHNPKNSGLSTNEIIHILKDRKEHIDKVLSTTDIDYYIGLETDILPTGKLALPEEAVEYVDYLIVSLHSSFRMNKTEMTKRVLKAFEFPKVKIFGHPTGRLLQKRDGVELDWEQIFKEAKERGIALEINSSPARLDLPDSLVQEAQEYDVQFIIDTDAHAVAHMEFMKYGVSVGRRGWLTKEKVVNTFNPSKFREWISY